MQPARKIAPWPLRLAIVCTVSVFGTCGGGSSSPSSTPPSSSTNPFQLTISRSGVLSASQITVSQGSRVLFINNDTIAHLMFSDPHPEHTDCPEINQVGMLQPGESRETGNLVTVRTCGVHDHNLPDVAGLKAKIVIQ
jgi:hypothetical protein